MSDDGTMSDDFVVGGNIAVRWHARAAAGGPFGRPTGPEEEVPGRNGRRQRFERGEIGWSPDQDMVVSVYRLRNEACFEWSTTRFHYDYFRYDVAYNGVGQGQANMQMRGRARIWTRLQGFGEYAFKVKGCIEAGLFGSDECKQGWTIPVRLQLGPSAETPDPGGPQVSGVIAERWHELGAWSGPLGKPIAEAVVDRVGGIHSRQDFEHGSILTAPEFGAGMVVAAYQRGRSIEVNWGGGDNFFNAFRVDVYFNGRKFLEKLVTPFPTELARPGASGGQFRLDNPRGDHDLYWFYINPSITLDTTPRLAPNPDPDVIVDPVALGVDDLSHIVSFSSGSTPQVQVLFKPGLVDVHLDPSAIDGSPAHAYASHRTRVSAIARHYAQTRPLSPGYEATGEDLTIKLIAHLQAVREDPDFHGPGELPSRILAPVALRGLVRGKVGTNEDYDMTLKGLMTIVYRYRDLLTEDDLDFLLGELVPADLVGAHDPDAEVYDDAPGPLVAPETENHQLMIESTRYLVNQLLLDRTGDQKYNNRTNELTNWLLGFMHTIAKHDFLEFNSRPYQRLSLHALLNLHEFARDKEIRTAAQIVLDYATVKFAISSNRQRRIGPFRRLKENTNRPDDERFNQLLGKKGDPQTGFFLMYAGPTGRDGTPTQWFPDAWTIEALIAGLATYRPSPAAYILAMTSHPPAQHRFYHGERPRLQGWPAPERADGGVETYYSSPSFLLTAGGMFLNSGYGHDEFTGYAQVAIAQSTTLLPTRADVTFADLIRFDRYPDERQAVNTAVHCGFACGANLEIPDKWLQLTGTPPTGTPGAEGWYLLDLNRDMTGYGPLGLYVAVYRTATFLPTAPDGSFLPPLKNLGLLYAIESDAMDFETFRQRTRDRNATLPATLELGGTYVFNTPDDPSHSFTFRLLPYGERYKARILKMDSQPLPEDLTSLPLVDGPYLKAPGGHDGFLEVRHPGCDTPLGLDFRNATNPIRLDNALACPEPLLARAQALYDIAWQLWNATRRREALSAMRERVQLFEQLASADPQRFQPELARALVNEAAFREADLAGAQAAGLRAVKLYQELAGVPDAVEYPDLSGLVPNEHWLGLQEAFYYLAFAQWDDGKHAEGLRSMRNRVRIYERLAAQDPGKYAADLQAARQLEASFHE